MENVKPKNGFLKKLLLGCLVAFLLGASVAVGFLLPFLYKFAVLEIFFSATPSSVIISQQINILILGADNTPGIKRSDTIMLLGINPKTKRASLVSIPRDTIATLPGRGLDKINHAYAYGGANLSRQTLEEFFQVSIPYYIAVDVKGLEKIIDELGGININVEHRMYYVDYAGGLYVNLYPGLQILNGRDAVAYVRFRRDGGDMKRIERQQKFLQALGQKLMKREDLFRTPNTFLKLMAEVKTNLEVSQILGIGALLRQCGEAGRLEMLSVSGSDLMLNGVYYLQPDLIGIEKIRTRFLGGKS